ncbi:MAG TPA: DUF1592 domain-containing protein [Polyangia bacterium]|nr:DUF1592 domain-containing protein [Polyangia bacterium]
MLLTKSEVVNTVRYLIDDKEAQALLDSDMFSITPESQKHFPPSDGEQPVINESSIVPLNNLSENVAQYVTANFSTLAKCTTPTDMCATSYLNTLATRAYRRQLTSDEQTRFTALYNNLRSQTVNGYAVTTTVQQAAGYAVWALLMSPQLMWRWELGGKKSSSAPNGTYVTDDELASQLSFFLTDQPPDDQLLAAAKDGKLRANLASHVSRILQTSASKTWMRRVMELYFLLNQVTLSPADPGKFPVDSGLLASMSTDAQMFLDDVLWNGNLKDLLLSRTAYVNTRLAETVYKIPTPSGATLDNFVKVTLPSDQRAGILTNAGFLTARSRSDGQDLVSRAKTVKPAFLCIIPPAPNLDALGDKIKAAAGMFSQQTGQEQAAARAAVEPCKSCHATFDSFGLPLEFYDAIARYRTTYDYLNNREVDGSAKLPAEAGGKTVKNAVELAEALADSPAFTNCVAKSMLQYGLTELSVVLPLPSQNGCAVADVVQRYQSGPQTFTGLLTAVTQSPAFVLRKVSP